jgi:Fe-S cluster assembly protein SufD
MTSKEPSVSTSTLDASRELPGPEWLQAQRSAAASALAELPIPTAEQEVWRYSRIAEFSYDRWQPQLNNSTITGAEGLVVDGELPVSAPIDPFIDVLNAAFMTPIYLRIPAGRVIPDPIVIEHHLTQSGVSVFPRLVLEVGADAEVTVIERFLSADGLDTLTCPVLEVIAAQASRVKYLGVNQLGRSSWMLAHQRSRGERDSSVLLGSVALGGDYARVRTDALAAGIGSSTKQVALYFADGDQMHDFRTIQTHEAPKSNSDLLFKGAVHDRSSSVYTGVIKIGPEAKGTVAYQTNRNLTLSAGAWAESVPNLEIETNDVKCSHASTVGPVDQDQQFYLESRGVRPEVAERLIVLGFFDEVLDQLPVVPELLASLRAQVAAKLDDRPQAAAK